VWWSGNLFYRQVCGLPSNRRLFTLNHLAVTEEHRKKLRCSSLAGKFILLAALCAAFQSKSYDRCGAAMNPQPNREAVKVPLLISALETSLRDQN
jgi:hypothetical protein